MTSPRHSLVAARTRLVLVLLAGGALAVFATQVLGASRFGAQSWEGATAASAVLVTGAAAIALWGSRPGRVLGFVAAPVLVALGVALSQPLPFVPVILPIGTHASAEAFARVSSSSGLPLRLVAQRDWYAFAVFGDEREMEVVPTYRTRLGGWFGGGTSRSSSLPATEPLTVSVGSGWSAGSAPGDDPYAVLAVFGRVAPNVERVEVQLASGEREKAFLRDGFYVWLAVKRPARPPELGGRIEEVLGVEVEAVAAYDAEGKLVALRSLPRR